MELHADAWASVLRHASPADTRACALVCAELRVASRDEQLWRHHCAAREIALGMDASAVGGWLDELCARARVPSYSALFQLLELTDQHGGVGYWSSLSRQPNGALLHTAWADDGLLVGTLTRRALPSEDSMLGLRTDRLFALRAAVEAAPAAMAAGKAFDAAHARAEGGGASDRGGIGAASTAAPVRVRLEVVEGERYLGGLPGAHGSSACVQFTHSRAHNGGRIGQLVASFADGVADSLHDLSLIHI